MPGFICVTGTETAAPGTDPFIWGIDNGTTRLTTEVASEGVTYNDTNGYFTVDPGYGGRWLFTWNVSVTGSNNTIHTYELVADPGGTPTVAFSSQRKLGTGADIGNASLSGFVANVADGDVFALRVSGDTSGQVDFGTLVAIQIIST